MRKTQPQPLLGIFFVVFKKERKMCLIFKFLFSTAESQDSHQEFNLRLTKYT